MAKSKAAAAGSGGGGGKVECRLCHRTVPPGVVCAKLDFRGKPGEGRPKIEPLKPMKGFFWKVLKLDSSDLDPASNKSVWSIVTEMMFDYDEFELLFQKKAGVEKKVEERKGPLVRSVLSPVRSGAIIALLGYLRVGVDQVIEAIQSNDETLLTDSTASALMDAILRIDKKKKDEENWDLVLEEVEALAALDEQMKKSPNADEVMGTGDEALLKLWRAFATDEWEQMLSKIGQGKMELKETREKNAERREKGLKKDEIIAKTVAPSSLALRVTLCNMRYILMEEIEKNESRFRGFNAAVAALIASSKNGSLRLLLGFTLSFGNYLNGGTNRGQADGFTMASVSKLLDTKDLTNTVSLLDYMIQIIQKAHPLPKVGRELGEPYCRPELALPEELAPLEEQRKFSMVTSRELVDATIAKFSVMFAEAKALAATIDSPVDPFHMAVMPFLEQMARRTRLLQALVVETVQSWTSALEYFGYRPKEIEEGLTAEGEKTSEIATHTLMITCCTLAKAFKATRDKLIDKELKAERVIAKAEERKAAAHAKSQAAAEGNLGRATSKRKLIGEKDRIPDVDAMAAIANRLKAGNSAPSG